MFCSELRPGYVDVLFCLCWHANLTFQCVHLCSYIHTQLFYVSCIHLWITNLMPSTVTNCYTWEADMHIPSGFNKLLKLAPVSQQYCAFTTRIAQFHVSSLIAYWHFQSDHPTLALGLSWYSHVVREVVKPRYVPSKFFKVVVLPEKKMFDFSNGTHGTYTTYGHVKRCTGLSRMSFQRTCL